MKLTKNRPSFCWEDDFLEADPDMYSENFDEDEAIASGWTPAELGFREGFRKA